MNFTGGIKAVFQHLGQHFHMIDGTIPFSKKSTQLIAGKSAEKCFSILPFLFYPIIKVIRLQLDGASVQVAERNPKPISQQPLSAGQNAKRLTGDFNSFEAFKVHIPDRNDFVVIVLGNLVYLADSVF
jgi:hypothetical protein